MACSSWLPIVTALLVLGSIGLSTAARAASVILLGDTTPAFYLTASSPVSTPSAGNQRFFQNLLGGGLEVVVLDSAFTASDTEIDEFYDGLGGVTSTRVTGALTPDDLSGANLLLAPLPDDAFSAAEVATISAFLGSGGSLLLMGEAQAAAEVIAANLSVNSLLQALAIPLSLDRNFLDAGHLVAMGAAIDPSSLTAGVDEFDYGGVSAVSGGSPLFRARTGAPFAALVPEPGTGLLISLGLAGLGASRRRHWPGSGSGPA